MTVTRQQWTVTSVVAAFGIIGGALAYTVDWAIKTDAQLGYSEAQQDSLVKAIDEIKQRVRVLEVRAGVRPKKHAAEPPQPKKGLLRRLLSKLF